MEMTKDIFGTGHSAPNTTDGPTLMGMASQWEDIHYGCMDMYPILLSPLPTSFFLFDNKIFYPLHENFPEEFRNTIPKTHLEYIHL